MSPRILLSMLIIIFPLITQAQTEAPIDPNFTTLNISPLSNGGCTRARPEIEFHHAVRLDDRVFDLDTYTFRNDIPGSPDQYWVKDPFNATFCWGVSVKTKHLLRIDTGRQQIDSFPIPVQPYDFIIGKQGIWLVFGQKFWLVDRHNGKILVEREIPSRGYALNLAPWGDDALITNTWLYRTDRDQFESFNPLPEDLQECRKVNSIHLIGEACLAETYDGNFLAVPGKGSVKIPLNLGSFYLGNHLVVDTSLAWLTSGDRLWAWNYTTGDTTGYPISGKSIPGDHTGRFLGFSCERGLIFFDKTERSSRVLDLPFGTESPMQMYSDEDFIFLTFRTHWAIIRFEKLQFQFSSSGVLDEYRQFISEWKTQTSHIVKRDFYAWNSKYRKMNLRYPKGANLKIDQERGQIIARFVYPFDTISDTLARRIVRDRTSGVIDSDVYTAILPHIVWHWYVGENIDEMYAIIRDPIHRQLLESADEQLMTPLCNAVIQTKEALDSLDRFPPPDDERLYQTGRNWLYYLQQTAFGEYPSFEKAYDFFRQLLRQYPKSPWADRAEHGLFTYIDHHQVATDDTWPEGDDKRARVEFVRFLHEYPASAKRSDIMYRLTNILLHSNDYDQAECYLDTIARMDPEFTRRAPDFAVKLRAIERFKYSKKWFFKAVQLPNVVRCGDSLRFVLQCCNLNKMDQPIDSTLKTCLINNAVVYLTREQKPGCEYWPGINVPLNCIQPPDLRATIVIKPGACFDAKYSLPVLCHPAPNEIGKPGRYKYQLALQHELFYQAIRQRAGEMLEIQE